METAKNVLRIIQKIAAGPFLIAGLGLVIIGLCIAPRKNADAFVKGLGQSLNGHGWHNAGS
jgi:hypothetical protein